jgi:hypothetical protein
MLKLLRSKIKINLLFMIVKKEKETHLSLYYKQYKLWTQCVTSAYLERKVIKLVCVSV